MQSDSDLKNSEQSSIRVNSIERDLKPQHNFESTFDDSKGEKNKTTNQQMSLMLHLQHAKQMEHGTSRTPPPRPIKNSNYLENKPTSQLQKLLASQNNTSKEAKQTNLYLQQLEYEPKPFSEILQQNFSPVANENLIYCIKTSDIKKAQESNKSVIANIFIE